MYIPQNKEVEFMATTAIPKSVSDFMQHITDLCGTEHAAWAENFNACFANTPDHHGQTA